MKISKAVTETKTNERNSLVNQVEIKYEMFCKIRNFRSFFVLVKKVVIFASTNLFSFPFTLARLCDDLIVGMVLFRC